MLKLIKLEMKKNKVRRYIKGVIIANLIILSLILFISYGMKNQNEVGFSDIAEYITIIDSLVRSTFIIFSAVLLSEFIIEEYKNKTIMVLFMYPVNRKKILIAKLMVVGVFTFLLIILSDIFISLIFYIFNIYFNFITTGLTGDIILKQSIFITVNALATVGISLIPLYFGMKKNSVSRTIVSAVILVSIFGSSTGGFSLSSIIVIPISFALLGIFMTYLSIRDIEHKDVV